MMTIVIDWIVRFFYRRVIPNLSHIVFIGILLFIATSLIYKGMDKIKGIFGMDTVSSLSATIKTKDNNIAVLDTSNASMSKGLEVATKSSKDAIKAVTDLNTSKDKSRQQLLNDLAAKDALIQKLTTNNNPTTISVKGSSVVKGKVTPTLKVSTKVTPSVKVKVQLLDKVHPPSPTLEKKISTLQINAIWNTYNSVVTSSVLTSTKSDPGITS